MQGQGVLFGQIAVVFGIVIAGVWSATQWTAAALGYQLRLGSPWFDLFGTPVYHPWRLFEWWFFFDAYAPHVFDIGGAIAGGSGLVAVLVAIAMSVWRSRQSKLVTTYGSARWATDEEIKRAGLTQAVGVFLGRMLGRLRHYLRHFGPEHIIAFAPTRTGKGISMVIPTLLSWLSSVVIHDIKGENWKLTAGWRSLFSHCLLFNPTDPASAAYNPLLEVRRGVHEVRDVQNIADILVDPEGALEKRNHWEKTSHALLVGAILHVLYAGEDKTLRGVANFLSDPACPFELTLHRMMTTKHLGNSPHPVVASAAREVLNKSDNERSGVLSTAMSFLGLYRDPTVAAVTSRCDWRIADLISAERPVSLYLVVPPSDISRTKPLVRLILNQIGRRLTESLDGSDGIERKRELLLMLDEFPALGRLDFFETALAFMVTHIGDVGHTLVAGPTGMGKSVLLATLALQFRRYFGSRVFAFDMGRSIRATILGLGGEYYNLGADGAIAFQPLARIDRESYRTWAAEWVEGRLLHEGVAVGPDEKAAIWSALGSLAGAPVEQRTMTGLSVLLQSNALRQALSPYVLGGAHGKLLDADADRLGAADMQCFEMEELMHSKAAVQAVLRYLFARFDERFDGAPTLLILDEAWLFLDEPSFAARIRQWLKTLRKKEVSVIFATQSLADIKDSSIAPAIIESCASRIFLPNPQATEPQIRTIYEGFGLNSRQIEIVATAQPKRDYYYQSRLGNRLFDLDLGPVALAFAGASTPQDQRDIDRVLTQAGAPGFAGAWLRHRGLDWAADLLPSAPAAASFLATQPLEVSP